MAKLNISDNYFLYVGSLAAYIFAITSPLFTTSSELFGFSFSKESISFFKSLEILKEQEYILHSYALIMFVIGLPVVKFIVLIFNINSITIFSKSIDSFFVQLQKYAMVDVFVIAILLIGSKSNPMFEFKIELGTYALMASVLLSIVLSINLKFNQDRMENLKKLQSINICIKK
jgi:uncharacterized paraquat-inducible protein A